MKITKRVLTNSSNKTECNKEEIQSKENCSQTEEIKEQSEVKACDNILPTGECVSCCKYDNAINFIQCAIESLAEIAKDDQIAKDSIANLGVVLLDLKGGCN